MAGIGWEPVDIPDPLSYGDRMSKGVFVALCLVAMLISPPAAPAAPGMTVGAVENALLWQTAEIASTARLLGLRSMVVTVGWDALDTEVSRSEADALQRVVIAAGDMRIVLGIHNPAMGMPESPFAQERYCEYVRNTLRRFPQINDVIVWNEPNTSFFWRPQFGPGGASEAPVRYQELLARCYDLLHELRPGVNVIGPVNSHWGNDNPNAFSNISHSPPRFIRAMGVAYRASGRTRPLFDTLGHHPYPRRSDEPPALAHEDETIVSLGDLDRLLAVMGEAFGGTAQRIPQNGLPIWYLETGYQTIVDPEKAGAYQGVENWPAPVPDVGAPPDQASQLTDSLRLTYCQPHIEAVFNFLLRDETDLAGWQTGLFWADGSPKDSLPAFRAVVQEINDRRVSCGPGAGAGGSSSAGAAPRTNSAAGGRASGARGAEPGRTRGITRMAYRGPRRVPFGALRPRARLTRGIDGSRDGLAGRQVTFSVGRDTYLTATDAHGTASVTPSPPTRPGSHRVVVRFRGDGLSLGSGASARVDVVNTRARVTSSRPLRLSRSLAATMAARSNGITVRGTLTLRRRGVARKVRLTALGVSADRRFTWVSGTDGRNRYDLHARRLPSGRVRLQVWRNTAPLHAPATLPETALLVLR